MLDFASYSVELLPDYDCRLEWIAPVAVSGPMPFMLLAAWCMNHRASQQHPWGPAKRQIEPALQLYRHLLRPGATVLAGGLNNNAPWDRPGRRDNFAGTVEALGNVGLISAYHAIHRARFGTEPQPTMYWQTRTESGRTYHVDFCFIPREWLPHVWSVEVGNFQTWVGAGLSDHVPLIIDVV